MKKDSSQAPERDLSDYNRRYGGAAIGARLRRLSERIDGDAVRVYAAVGETFEQRWFGVLNQLALQGPLSIGELAKIIGVTHVSISQTCRSLAEAGHVTFAADSGDKRRRAVRLTAKGRALTARLSPIWAVLAEVAFALNAEAGDAVAALDRLEAALNRRSLFERATAMLHAPKATASAGKSR